MTSALALLACGMAVGLLLVARTLAEQRARALQRQRALEVAIARRFRDGGAS